MDDRFIDFLQFYKAIMFSMKNKSKTSSFPYLGLFFSYYFSQKSQKLTIKFLDHHTTTLSQIGGAGGSGSILTSLANQKRGMSNYVYRNCHPGGGDANFVAARVASMGVRALHLSAQNMPDSLL